MKLQRLSPQEWEGLAEQAHLAVFGEVRPASMNRIDFALVTERDSVPLQYMTCREADEETVYINYGGSFPSAKGTPLSYQCFELEMAYLQEKYKRATMLIENTNQPMLKFAMKQGLVITGIRNFKGSILLEHTIEWSKQ